MMKTNINMSSTSLEVTMLSAEDLRIERRPVKKNTYAIVRTENFNECATKLDQDGGSNPSWNEKLVIDLPRHAQFLTIDVYCKPSSTTSGKLVGTAKIPVSDFMGGYVPANCLHCLSYRLKDPRGDKNGIVNILVTVKLGSPQENSNSGQISYGYSTSSTASGSALGIPAAGVVLAAGGGTSYGVVTGVPIWCGSII